MDSIVTITFFKYGSLRQKWVAFTNMGLLPSKIARVPGLSFFKLMGSGRRGFSLRPNWGTYALLSVWDNIASAKDYFSSSLFEAQKTQCQSHNTYYMRAFQARGLWDDVSPFEINGQSNTDKPIAVITRATLKTRHLYNFWKHVPIIRNAVFNHEGRIFSIGVGERPFVMQATFSIWESSQKMEAFAHHGKQHKKAIDEVRAKGMFKEELYARFEMIDSDAIPN